LLLLSVICSTDLYTAHPHIVLPLSWKMTDTALHQLLLIFIREWRNCLLSVGTMPPVTNSYIIVVLYVCLIYMCQWANGKHRFLCFL